MSYRGAMLLLGAIPLLVGVGSYVVGERTEVIALRTLDAAGHAHDTKLWIVDVEGTRWVRGVRPNLQWIERIRANPRVELVRGDETQAYTASIVENADDKKAVDAAMAAKYGWLDLWYERVVRPNSIPIRLDPDGAQSTR